MKIVLALLSFVCIWGAPALAHEHTIATPEIDRKFLDTLERPEAKEHPEWRGPEANNSHLCCTDKDAVKVDAEWEISQDSKYPERVWFVWINVQGPDGKVRRERMRVPPEKVVNEPSPSGQAYVYLWANNSIQCFVPPLDRY